ncbi:MAG: hypothetical protein J0H42_14255 [Rhizobiales bacterium]|nr:hypothetical protein [Hyphomicrobiales bacterium]
MIEAAVALAATGRPVANNSRSTRTLEQHGALTGTASWIASGIPRADGRQKKPGRFS